MTTTAATPARRQQKAEFWVVLRDDGRIATKKKAYGRPLIFETREEAERWLNPNSVMPMRLAKFREVEMNRHSTVPAAGVPTTTIRYTVRDPNDRLSGDRLVRLPEARRILGELLANGIPPTRIQITEHTITNEALSIGELLAAKGE